MSGNQTYDIISEHMDVVFDLTASKYQGQEQADEAQKQGRIQCKLFCLK